MHGVPTYQNMMIVYLRRIQVLFLCTIRYSYKYACNNCRKTTIDLGYIIILNYIITMKYFPSAFYIRISQPKISKE